MTIDDEVRILKNAIDKEIVERFRIELQEAMDDPSDIEYEMETVCKIFAKAYPHLKRAFEMVVVEEMSETWNEFNIPYLERKTGFENI